MLTFRPVYIISEWEEPHTLVKRITIAVTLTCGVPLTSFAARVVEDGKVLQLTITWPEALLNPQRLCRKWLQSKGSDSMTPYHPEILGFQRCLKSLRSGWKDSIQSTSRIVLPFIVEKLIDLQKAISFGDGTNEKVVYIRLRQSIDEYAADQRRPLEFETV